MRQFYLLFVLLWLSGLSGLFFACVPAADEVDILLERAENYMEAHPDSSLFFIQQIPHPDELHGHQQADYALLLTQARDKNYLDSLQSEPLIKVAVDYYKSRIDKIKAGKAFFYYGKVLSRLGKNAEAMAAYLQAEMLLGGSREYKLQGLLEENIGMLNYGQRMFDASILNFGKTINFYKLAEDTLGMVYGYRNLARGYTMKANNDSARWCINEGLKLLTDTTHRVRPSFFQLLGMMAERDKDYEAAIGFFRKALLHEPNALSRYRYYVSLGRAYLAMMRLDEAEESFSEAMECDREYTQAGACNYMYELEKMRGDYKKALFYKELSDSLLKIVHNENLRSEMLTLQKKYENDKLRMENEQIRLEHRNQLYLLLLVILFTLVAIILLRYRYKKHFQRSLDKIKENEEKIKEYIFLISEFKRKGEEEQLVRKDNVAELKSKIDTLAIENKELRENIFVKASFVLEQLKKQKLLVQYMTAEEKQCLFDFMDLVFANFISRLNKKSNLSKNELVLSALLKVGFTTHQLMFIFECERNSVYRMKLRLKEHLSIDKEKSLEEFIFFF